MQRKTSSSPTKIYTYGCRPPVDGAEVLADQLRRAHAYRNGLVEIERRRREGIAATQAQHDTLGPLLTMIDHLETAVGEGRSEMRLLRSGGKKEQAARKDERLALAEKIREHLVDLGCLRWFRAWHKRVLKDDADLKASYEAVGNAAYVEAKALRNGEAAPYWGTYLVVDKSAEDWRVSADAPKFLRYDGSGRVAVQLQGGLTVAEALSGQDTRLRILPATPRVKKDGSLAPVRDTYRTVKIRVGSNGRAPVWATLPFVMHRPLPEDGVIKWAWVICRRVGVRYRYDLQITVEAPSFASPGRGEGAVAIDIGTRDLPGDELRAAIWLDSKGSQDDVRLPTTRLSSPASHGKGRRRIVPCDLGKCEDLRGIRDKNLDAVKVQIAEARARAPEWFRERTKSVAQWRSPARAVTLRRAMREGSSAFKDKPAHEAWDDEVLGGTLDAYLKQDRHLLDWETRERSRHLNRRRDQYRVFAARMTNTYSTIVIAKRDYRRSEKLAEDGPSSDGHSGRVLMRNASPGELCAEIKRAAKARGVRVVEVEIEGDTAWALDSKVCERLLASGEVLQKDAEALAAAGVPKNEGSRKVPSRRRLGTAEHQDPLAGQDVTL